MASETLSILQNLASGSEARLFADAGALQIGKYGLYAFAALSFILGIKMLLTHLGFLGGSKSALHILGFVGGLAVAFLLYTKAQSFAVLNTNDPVIVITAQKLSYDTKRNGWAVRWADIASIETHKDVHQQKQSVAQETKEIRAHLKPGATVEWAYEVGDNSDVAAVKKLSEESHYLVIDPAPLGISHEPLQEALERYRAGR